MSKFKAIIAILILLIIIIFTYQNMEMVSISFLFWNAEVSRALLMLFCFLSGILVASLISFSNKNRYR
ncbi:MAG TPA: LapA family protein [Fulvivirga sp.]|nr:LapA family protein [Fulvivirga sp.]